MIPSATLIWTGHATQPTGTLRCDGSFVSQATYAALFAHLGHAYNAGTDPGDGTFKLPSATDRFLLGKAASGTGSTLGGTGGTQDHTHTVTSHTHTVVQPDTHPAHAANAAHNHDNHTTTTLVGSGAQTGFSGPITHSGTGTTHTHGGADHPHTGMAVGSAGGGTTGATSPPRIRLCSWIYTDDYYADPPVGAIVAAGTAQLASLDSNTLTGDDVGFEGATVGNWVADTNCSVTTTTAQAQTGTRSLQVTDTATGAAAVRLPSQPVEPGYDYRYVTFVRAATTTRSVRAHLLFYSDIAETTLISDIAGDSVTESNSAWTAAVVHAEAPAGSVSMRVVIEYTNGAAAEVHYVDTNYLSRYAWLICTANSLRRDNHADLFDSIGTTFGTVDGDHFTLPDMRGRIPQDGGTLAGVAGSIDHTHTTPDHTHSTTQAAAHATHSTAGGHAHDAHAGIGLSSTVAITNVVVTPATHATQGGHTHDAHSAHTGASAAADGSGTTGSANPPIVTVFYYIRAAARSRTPFLLGMIHPFGGSTIPSQYKLCDGTVLTRTSFPGLFNHIGTSYNTGGEAGTDFRLPDARQRLLMGVAASGTGNTLGSYFGAIDHTHTGPSHSHAATQAGAHATHASQGGHTHDAHTVATRTVGAITALIGPTTHATGGAHTHDAHSAHTGFAVDAGGTEATSTTNPPFQAVNYIVLWRYEVDFFSITEHVAALTRFVAAFRTQSVITEHVLSQSKTINKTGFGVITEHVTALTRSVVLARSFDVTTEHVTSQQKLVTKTAFNVITEHVTALTRTLIAARTFAVITEHVTDLTRRLVLARSFDVVTEHVTALSRSVVLTRSFGIVTEHDISLSRSLVASRSFNVVTEHVGAFTRTLVASRTFDVVTEHVASLTRQLGLQRIFDVITEHELSVTKILTFDRKFFVITEHVVTAQVCMDFDDVPTSEGGGGTTVIKPIFVFDDF